MPAQELASWIFGGLSFAFLLSVFWFSPKELPPELQKVLALISAVLTGLFGYFFTGSLTVQVGGAASKFGTVVIQGGGGMGLFLVTLLWWRSPRAPVVPTLSKHVTAALEDSLFNALDIYKPTVS